MTANKKLPISLPDSPFFLLNFAYSYRYQHLNAFKLLLFSVAFPFLNNNKILRSNICPIFQQLPHYFDICSRFNPSFTSLLHFPILSPLHKPADFDHCKPFATFSGTFFIIKGISTLKGSPSFLFRFNEFCLITYVVCAFKISRKMSHFSENVPKFPGYQPVYRFLDVFPTRPPKLEIINFLRPCPLTFLHPYSSVQLSRSQLLITNFTLSRILRSN